jgi:hypothetical protein
MIKKLLKKRAGVIGALTITVVCPLLLVIVPATKPPTVCSRTVAVLPRAGEAIADLRAAFGPKWCLDKVEANYSKEAKGGGGFAEYCFEQGQLRRLTLYKQSQTGEKTDKPLIQSEFLQQLPHTTLPPEYKWTKVWLPDGCYIFCQRIETGKYQETVKYPGPDEQTRQIKEQTLYFFKEDKDENSKPEGKWIVAQRRAFDPHGQPTYASWVDENGDQIWSIMRDGITMQCHDDGNQVTESDFHGDQNEHPFRRMKINPLSTVLWLLNDRGQTTKSITYRHAEATDEEILPLVESIAVMYWQDDKPQFEQTFYLDMKASDTAATPQKLVYRLRYIDVMPLYNNDKVLRLKMSDDGRYLQMVSLANARPTSESELFDALKYEQIPQPPGNSASVGIPQYRSRGKTVWILKDTGELASVAVIDDGGTLMQFSGVKSTAIPKTTADLDPDLPFPNRYCDWIEKIDRPLEPANWYLEPKPVDPPSLMKACPKVDPKWLKIPELPPEPARVVKPK